MNHSSEFLLDLYRLARESPLDAFQGHAMSLIRPIVTFDSGRWTSGSYRDPVKVTFHHVHLENEPREMLSAHAQVRSKDSANLAALKHKTCNPGFIYHSPTRFPSRSAAEMHDYQKRFGHQNVLNVFRKHIASDQWHYRLIALYRRRGECQFSRRDLVFMKAFLPHLTEALSINHVVNLPSLVHQPAASGFVLGIAEPDRTVQYRDPRLDDLLRREWPGHDRIPDALWDCLTRGLCYRGHQIVAVAECVQGMLFFKVRPLCDADKLSPRELEVARLASSGSTHKLIARELGISATTARNHLQNIHEKLEVHNAAGMIAALRLMH